MIIKATSTLHVLISCTNHKLDISCALKANRQESKIICTLSDGLFYYTSRKSKETRRMHLSILSPIPSLNLEWDWTEKGDGIPHISLLSQEVE